MKQRKAIAFAVFAMVAAVSASAELSIGISVNLAPPPLPVYTQPPLPGPDFLWTPGYWAWDDDAYAYFWVPGTWVRAPRPGLLWTPPWWGWIDGTYVFHTGYWGPHVGFYGGVPYGFGYAGVGFQGGRWDGGHVSYNSAVTNVTNVTNVYRTTVVENRVTRVSYNGGPGGVQARPSIQEQAAAREAHVAPTGNQQIHFMAARADPRLLATANHGRPPVPATTRPLLGAPQGADAHAPMTGARPPAPDRDLAGGDNQAGRPDRQAPDDLPQMGPRQDGRSPALVKRDATPSPRGSASSRQVSNAGGRGDLRSDNALLREVSPPRAPAAPRPNPHPTPPRPHVQPHPQPHPHPQGHPHSQGEHHDEHR